MRRNRYCLNEGRFYDACCVAHIILVKPNLDKYLNWVTTENMGKACSIKSLLVVFPEAKNKQHLSPFHISL